jgi:hypothetical protein
MYAFEPEDIPFHLIENLGLTRQMLEESGDLELLLKGERSGLLTNLKTIQSGVERRFAAHIRLVRHPEGSIRFRIEAPTINATEVLATNEDISLEKIPFEQVAKYGITEAFLRERGDLERLLKGGKTEPIRDVNFFVAGQQKKADVQLYLLAGKGDTLKFKVEFIKKH